MENHDGEIINEEEDTGESILSRFITSTKEHNQHLCTVVDLISQIVKESTKQTLIYVIYYFGAAISSLTKISDESNPAEHIITSVLNFYQ